MNQIELIDNKRWHYAKFLIYITGIACSGVILPLIFTQVSDGRSMLIMKISLGIAILATFALFFLNRFYNKNRKLEVLDGVLQVFDNQSNIVQEFAVDKIENIKTNNLATYNAFNSKVSTLELESNGKRTELLFTLKTDYAFKKITQFLNKAKASGVNISTS